MKTDSSFKKWFVFGIVAVGIFMSTLDGSIVNIALPVILDDFGVSLSTVKWVTVIYLFTISCFILPFGRLSDIVGRRRVYTRGLMIFLIGSLCCGLSQSAGWLIASRAFQGIGAAMVMACTPALIVDNFGPKERGRALGMIGAVVASGLTIGPGVGGLILEKFTWPWIFFINLPVGLAAIIASMRVLVKKELTSSKESFDWPGAVLLGLCFAGFIMALSKGGDWGWISTPTLGLFAVFGVCGIAFIITEVKAAHPLVDMSLFSIRLFAWPLASAVTLFISLFAVIFLLPFFLKYPAGFSDFETGKMLVVPFIFLLAGAPIFGSLSDKIGSRLLCTAGMTILAAALFFFSIMPASTNGFPVFWRLVLVGVGTSMFSSPNNAIALSAVPVNRRGIAAALVATARNMGMIIGIAMAGAVFSATFAATYPGQNLNAYNFGMQAGFMAAFHRAMFWAGAVAAIGAVLAFLRGR